MDDTSLKIAVVGAGVAGLTTAHILQRRHQVTLFEKNTYLGGHAHTFLVDNGPDKGTPVDMGFPVLNDRGYPTFHRLLRQLEVPVKASDMSFGYYDEKSRLQYSGKSLNGLFAQRSNLWNPSFWRMLFEGIRFPLKLRRDMNNGRLQTPTLGEYLEGEGFPKEFLRHHLFPMASTVWSASRKDMMDFPADIFARFFEDNGMLGFTGGPKWQRIVGGSHSLVKAFIRNFKGSVKIGSPVGQIKRTAGGATVKCLNGEESAFDKVVLAVHADEVLGLLEEPSEEEQRLLSVWQYQKNHLTLHTDVDIMPPLKRAWASLNYIREMDATKSEPASVTYHMNRIQGLRTHDPYFVTLNRVRPIPVKHVLKEVYYTNPTHTKATAGAQRELPGLNGVNHTYYCGSYFGFGFHEDAVKSGVAVGRCFGLDL